MKNNLKKNTNKAKVKLSSKEQNKNQNKINNKVGNKLSNKLNKNIVNKSNSKKVVSKKEDLDKKSSNKVANKVVKNNKKLMSQKKLKDMVANSLLNPTQSFYTDSVYSETAQESRRKSAKFNKTKLSTKYVSDKESGLSRTLKSNNNNIQDVKTVSNNRNDHLNNNNNVNTNSRFLGVKLFLSIMLMVSFLGTAYFAMNKEQNFFHFNSDKVEQVDNELNQENVRGNLIIDNSLKEKEIENTNSNIDSSLSSSKKQEVSTSKNSLNKKPVKKHKANKSVKSKNKKK